MKRIWLISLLVACSLQAGVFAATTMIDSFENTKSWNAFQGPKSTITVQATKTDIKDGASAIQIKFNIQDWGGVGTSFNPKKKWNKSDSLQLYIKNTTISSNKLRIEIADNNGERFEYQVPLNFTGWKTLNCPLARFNRRADWQPNTAPKDGLTLTAVEGISFSLVSPGKATICLDGMSITSK